MAKKIQIRDGNQPVRPRAASSAVQNPTDSPERIPEWLERLRYAVDKKTDGARKVFLRRSVDAILELSMLPEKELETAASASSNFLVLLKALEFPEVLAPLEQLEPLAPSFLQGIRHGRTLLEEGGGVIGVDRVADLLSMSRQAVNRQRQERKLLAISVGKRGYLYPVWQFEGPRTLPGLAETLRTLSGEDPWTHLEFFLRPNHMTDGKRPLDLLREGNLESVLHAAEAEGEMVGV
jgi:hypothetical protein